MDFVQRNAAGLLAASPFPSTASPASVGSLYGSSSSNSNTSGSSGQTQKKAHRQTRINEHLKAAKKSSAAGKRARAASPKKSTAVANSPPAAKIKTSMEAVIAAQQVTAANASGNSSSIQSIDGMGLGSPMKERQSSGSSSSRSRKGAASNKAQSSTIPLPSATHPVPTLPNMQQHAFSTTSSPERMQYAQPSHFDGQFTAGDMLAETPQQSGYPYYPTPQTVANATDYSMNRSASMTGRRYTSNSRGAKTVASSSSSSSLANTRKSSISSNHSGSIGNTLYSPLSPDVLPPPLKRRNTNSTTTSVSSGALGGSESGGGSMPVRSLTSLTSLSMTPYPSISTNMSTSFSTSGVSSSFTGMSPKTPGSSSGMMLAISTDGKACITPRSELSGFNFGSVHPSPVSMPLDLGSAMMGKSASQALASSLPVLSPPSMRMRSNTMDPRLSQPVYSDAPSTNQMDSQLSAIDGVFPGFPSFSLPSEFLLPSSISQEPLSIDTRPAQSLYPSDRQRSSPRDQSSVPHYPEKQQLQSSWKFPLVGLNLSTPAQRSDSSSSEGSSSRPGTALTSSFPSMHSLNKSIVAVDKNRDGSNGHSGLQLDTAFGAVAVENGSGRKDRQACIQAWLDSPEEMDESASAGEAWSTLPSRQEWVENEDDADSPPPSTRTGSSVSLNLAIRPQDLVMSRQKSDMPKSLTFVYDEEEEEQMDGIRVSGKSVKPLRATRKRRMDDDGASANEQVGEDTAEDVVAIRAAEKAGLGSPIRAHRQPTPVSTSKASPKKGVKGGKAPELFSSPVKKGSNVSVVAAEAKNRKGRKNGKKGTKGGRNKGSIGCGCGAGDDGEPMVQCDTCATWYHLSCLELDDEELGAEWFCSICIEAGRVDVESSFTAAVAEVDGQQSYPSPASPVRVVPIDLSAPSREEAPTTPPYPSILHEPTFSHHTTPKYDYSRQFEDAHLVPAPMIRRTTTPSTPQQTFVPGHNVTHSLSRQYAPVTPRVGYSMGGAGAVGTAFTPAQSGRRQSGGQDMWGNYLPSTPSNGFVAHGRRLSRHFRAPSNAFHWEDLAAPSSSRASVTAKDEDAERARQWGLFYANTNNGTSNHPHHTQLGQPIPTTPPMGGQASSFAASSSADHFLPPMDPEEAARQRFLELNSTPSRWGDPQRFPSMPWDD